MARNIADEQDTMDDLEYTHRPDTEPVPGYRLIAPLGRGGFGEVWKCEAPGGLLKAIKFVQGRLHALDDSAPAEEELRAIQRIKSIRHPFILSMERVEYVAGELVIVLELADKSLADALRTEQEAGRPGIAREPLLAYLREAAEALDLMNARHGLQHLDIKPQNLFLVSNHVKVGDFGLVNSFAGNSSANPPSGQTRPIPVQCPSLGAITPLYASPEVFQGTISAHCDQYSLAIVYQELLTGTLPYKGKNVRQLLMQHTMGQPDLQALPAGDRELVARALAKAPGDRFPSCSDFVQALVAGMTEVLSATISTSSAPVVKTGSGASSPEKSTRKDPQSQQDTRRTPAIKTGKTPIVALRPPVLPCGETFTGLKVLDLVSRTPLTEVWNARIDRVRSAFGSGRNHSDYRPQEGEARLVKVLFGCADPGDEGVARLRALSHPALAPIDVLLHSPGRLILSTPPGDRSLRDVLAECQAQGLPGIPRRQLLGYLKTVAEALDFLAEQGVYHLGLNPRALVLQVCNPRHSSRQGAEHLGLNPRALVLQGEQLWIADFGLAQLVWLPAGQALSSLNVRYSPPELAQSVNAEFIDKVGPACDQYSLALIYHELLTGFYLAPAKAQRSSMTSKGEPAGFGLARSETEICVDRLPASDRMLVARALHPDPRHRWESAYELIRALESVSGEAGSSSPPAPFTRTPPAPERATTEATDVLLARFGTNLTTDVIRQRLEGFRQQWQGTILTATPRSLAFRMPTPRSFWQRWTGQQPGLEVELQIGEPELDAPAGVQTRTEVRMDLRPHNCTREQSGEVLKAVGPLLVESVRTHLRQNPRGRLQERTAWHHPLHLCAIQPDGSLGPPVECQGKDISLNGIGFYLPGKVPSSNVLLRLPKTEQTQQMSLPARIVRAQGCGDGWYEVGAVLLPPTELPAEEDAPESPAAP